MAETKGFIGRAREADQAIEAIRAGNNLLVIGKTGVGKTVFMRHVWGRLVSSDTEDSAIAWVPSGTTKIAFLTLARQVHESFGLAVPDDKLPPQVATRARRQGWLPWKDLHRTVRRMPVADLAALLLESLEGQKMLVFLESMEVPPSQADFFRDLIEKTQVVAGMDARNHRARVEKILWKFQTQITLKPLPLEDSEQIIERWLKEHPLRFSYEALKPRFVRAIAQQSGGVPEAIYGMLAAAGNEDEITPAKVASFHHEAGRQYLDMTPVIVVGFVGFMALRYVSRGLSDVEMAVLAGVGSALFMGLRLFMSKLSMKPR